MSFIRPRRVVRTGHVLRDAFCSLPCCWPPRPLPKVRVWRERDDLAGGATMWRWEITDPRRAAKVLAHGSAFDHPSAVSNGLYALAHLTEVLVRG